MPTKYKTAFQDIRLLQSKPIPLDRNYHILEQYFYGKSAKENIVICQGW